MNRDTVNLFFACDDGYVPFLAVTLTSIKKMRNLSRRYAVRVLNTGISASHKKKIKKSLECEGFEIDFPDITQEVEKITKKLHTRDYYSKTTYYRLFIPELYPELDKALYLDCDLVLKSDVAELYDVELSENLVGAASDAFVSFIPRLHGYVTERIGVKTPSDYFNAGVLLMNLKEMRRMSFGEKFVALLGRVTFTVAQDQDYLNAICNGKRLDIGDEWNCMPGFYTSKNSPKLIHYNLDSKPWHRSEVEYSDVFWKYADESCYSDTIREIKATYRQEKKAAGETLCLIDVAEMQGRDLAENKKIKRAIRGVMAR